MAPVIHEASSEARKSAADAISSGVHPAQRVKRSQSIEHAGIFINRVFPDRGDDGAGRDHIRADALRPVPYRQILREVDGAALAALYGSSPIAIMPFTEAMWIITPEP